MTVHTLFYPAFRCRNGITRPMYAFAPSLPW